jgi:hypothetical protein
VRNANAFQFSSTQNRLILGRVRRPIHDTGNCGTPHGAAICLSANRRDGTMRILVALAMKIQPGQDQTSVSIWMKNETSDLVIIIAPHPGNSVFLYGQKHEPHSRIRGVAKDRTPKSYCLEPNAQAILTIDLTPFFSDVREDTLVVVNLELTNELGDKWEESVEGLVCLNIPSFRERDAESRKRPRYQGPPRGFDVSDYSQFRET